MRPRLFVPAALVLLVSLLGGCSYAARRARDVSDILSVGASMGGGLIVRAVPTRLLTLEVGARKDEHFYGWRRRHWEWEESSYGLWLASWWTPRLGEERFTPWSWDQIIKTSHMKLTHLDPGVPVEEWRYHAFIVSGARGWRWVDVADVEVDIGILFGGLQLMLRPGELLDFLAGIAGLDLAGDDAETEPEGPPPAGADRVPAP